LNLVRTRLADKKYIQTAKIDKSFGIFSQEE